MSGRLPRWPLLGRLTAREGRSGPRGAARGAGADRRRPPAWRWAGGAAVALVLLHLLLFPPLPRLDSAFPAEGQIAEEDIRAPFAFKAPLLERDVEMRRLEKVLVEPPVLRRLAGGPEQMPTRRFDNWREAILAQAGRQEVPLAERVGLLSLQFPSVPPEQIRRVLESESPSSLLDVMGRALGRAVAGGVVDMLPPGGYAEVVIQSPQGEVVRDAAQVVPQTRLVETLESALREEGTGQADLQWMADLLRHFVTPDLVYDAAASRERQDRARADVPTEKEFIKGERIVERGVRVTEQEALYLEQLHRELVQKGGVAGAGERLRRELARLLLLAAVLGLYAWIGRIHFPELMGRPRHLLAVAAAIGLLLAGAALALSQPGLGPHAVPIALLALLATVLFGDRVGYASTLAAIAMLAPLPDVGGGLVLFWLVLGVVTVLAVRRIRKRSQFYQTIALLTGLALALLIVQRLAGGAPLLAAGGGYLVGVLTPIVSVAFALFLLPVVEPIVGVSSDLTLLELSDLNHPLLKRMALEAQGTYHHSQVVSQLAEQAAHAIGANSLLTRVGALFHDIGKLGKPVYFVENQAGGYNKHDELSPSMSALVVAAHVKNGIELARKWRLPQAVIDFIPEHHGTSVMEFFYHKALEDAENETVKVDDFRYPGPKPQRRETAILMLADAVEAAARSLTKPTPGRIREITKQIVDRRLLSGELDESNLTLSDLARIREAFIPLLTGIHHQRIAYPNQRERQEREREPAREAAGPRPRESESEAEAVRPGAGGPPPADAGPREAPGAGREKG